MIFRRKRPSSLTKAQHSNAPNENSSSNLYDFHRLESIVRGILAFAAGFLVLMWQITFRPSRINQARRIGSISAVVPPYTFLTLATFLAIKSARLALTTLFLLLLAAERGCAPETQNEVQYPNINEIFHAPSVEDLLFTGIPAVLLIIVAVNIFARTLSYATNDARQHLVETCAYIIGFQYLLLAAVAAVVLPFAPYLAELVGKREEDAPFRYLPSNSHLELCLILMAIVVAWPATLLGLRVFQSIRVSAGPISFSRRVFKAAILAIVLSFTTLLCGFVVTYPASWLDLQRQIVARPALEIALLESVKNSDGFSSITLAVTNRSRGDIVVLPKKMALEFVMDDKVVFRTARLVGSSKNEMTPIILEQAKLQVVNIETSAVTVEGDCLLALRSSETRSNFFEGENATLIANNWWLSHFRYPKVTNAMGRLCMKSVNKTGKSLDLLAHIRAQ